MAAIVAATGCTSPSGGSQYVPAPLGGPGLGKDAMPRDAITLADVREPTLAIVYEPCGQRCGPPF